MAESLFDFFNKYPTDEDRLKWVIKQRWPNGIVCPKCGTFDKNNTNICIFAKGREKGRFQCRKCRKKFSINLNSFMTNSKIPLSKWIWAIHCVLNHNRGIDSLSLNSDIGVHQTNAWFTIQRIFNVANIDRLIEKGVPGWVLGGTVEMDEVHIGGIDDNRHREKQAHNKEDEARNQLQMLGMVARKGNVIYKRIPNHEAETIGPIINKYIKKGTNVYTDQMEAYPCVLEKGYIQETIVHQREWQKWVGRKRVSTNGAESQHHVLKSVINGIHCGSISEEYSEEYANMHSFRRSVKELSLYKRMSRVFNLMEGTRITPDEIFCLNEKFGRTREERRKLREEFGLPTRGRFSKESMVKFARKYNPPKLSKRQKQKERKKWKECMSQVVRLEETL
jgi:transposase-like protein